MPVIIKYTGPFKNWNFWRRPAEKSVMEITKVVEEKAKASFFRQRSRKNTRYTGTLIASFQQTPVSSEGNTRFKAIVFAGGPSAPYAPFVEWKGWKTKTGRKSAYFFMKEGAEKGEEASAGIIIKNFSGI